MNTKKIGLHLDNWYPVDNFTWDYLQRMDPVCLTIMATQPIEDIRRLGQMFPQTTVILRAYYPPYSSYVENFSATYSLWLMCRQYWPDNQIMVTWFNEPNIESFGTSADGIKSFYEAWEQGWNWIKGQPDTVGMKVAFTPMAPGNRDIPVIEEPGTRTYMEYCQPLIARCDAVALHIYAPPGLGLNEWYGGRTIKYLPWCQGKPIWIKESAISADNQENRKEETKAWFNTWIIPEPQIKGVTQWIGNITGDPQFDVNRHGEKNGTPRPVWHGILELLAEPEVPGPIEPPVEEDEMLVEQYPEIYEAWKAAGGVENNFKAHLLGIGTLPVDKDTIPFLNSQNDAARDQLSNVIKKYPF